MADPQKALQTQLANIEKKTGQSLAQIQAAVRGSGKTKHGEIRAWLMETFQLGHGDANTVAHVTLTPPAPEASSTDVLGEIYAGKKAHLRPVHDAVMAALDGWGGFEVAPKKGYVSLRRKKQFAMLGPKSNDRIELGLNLKDDVGSARIVAQKPGGMCQFAVSLTSPSEVDAEVIGVLKAAFEAAG